VRREENIVKHPDMCEILPASIILEEMILLSVDIVCLSSKLGLFLMNKNADSKHAWVFCTYVLSFL
jgi:hypothetical protein